MGSKKAKEENEGEVSLRGSDGERNEIGDGRLADILATAATATDSKS